MATQRQKKAIANLLENGGIVSKAMLDAGYTAATSKTPQKLTDSVAFRSMADRIPDDLLEKVHLDGLKAKQFRYSPEGELIQTDDFPTRHKYMDSAYKLKGSYAPDKSVTLTIDATPTDRTRELGNRLIGLFRRGNRPSV